MKVELAIKLDRETIDYAVKKFVYELIVQHNKEERKTEKRYIAAKKAWKEREARERKRRLEKIKEQ